MYLEWLRPCHDVFTLSVSNLERVEFSLFTARGIIQSHRYCKTIEFI